MEVVPDPDTSHNEITSNVKNKRRNPRRRSVCVVESEAGRRDRDPRLMEHWSTGNDIDIDDDRDEKQISDMNEMMTQDCIEWDEGRHNVDLRKLADPNFQTPHGTHPTLMPTTDEETAGSPRGSSSSRLLRTTTTTTTSHGGDSQSPVPRRRPRRRRESLDVIARHIPDHPRCDPEDPATMTTIDPAAAAAVAVVSTERHAKRRYHHSTIPPNTTVMTDITNQMTHATGKSVTSARDGKTDFADLLQQIQTNHVDGHVHIGTAVVGQCENHCLPAPQTMGTVQDDTAIQRPPSTTDSDHCVPATNGPHRPAAPVREGAVVSHEPEEFDDVLFSSDDLAAIDALVQTARPPSLMPRGETHHRHEPIVANGEAAVTHEEHDPFGEIPDIDVEAIVKESVQPSTAGPAQKSSIPPTTGMDEEPASLTAGKGRPFDPSQTPKAQKETSSESGVASAESPGDPFDDLPDFDVEAFVSKQDFVLPTMSCSANDNDDDEFPDIDFASLDLDRLAGPPQQMSDTPPSTNAPVRNRRRLENNANGSSFLTCSRYKVLNVTDDSSTYTKTVSLAEWTTEMLVDEDEKSRLIHHPSDHKRNHRIDSKNKWKMVGAIYLRGEWYYTRLQSDDTIHIVSLSGRFCTDLLPIIFHTCPPTNSDTDDDLLLIVHPDILLTPTIISETVGCSRRAVLKQRMGATGLTSKAALDGTMRHALFEATMKSKDFTNHAAIAHVKSIVRENAESLLACNVSTREAEKEIVKFLPQLQRFANEYTEFRTGVPSTMFHAKLESHGAAQSSSFVAKSVEAVEEPVISPELGLKGNVDMLVKAVSTTSNQSPQSPSLMGIELKTGHHQTPQNIHVAQLALYVIMLQTRSRAEGIKSDNIATSATKSGVLLYMNNESIRAIHIAPVISEIKSLIGMRNVVAIETVQAQRPRGVRLSYEGNETEATKAIVKVDLMKAIPPELPELLPNSFSCKKCYSNRECMMYSAASQSTMQDIGKGESHRDLRLHFTGHLVADEYEYFMKWDRLIDLEADASSSLIARSWLRESKDVENESAACISSLTFDPNESSPEAVFDESWFASIGFQRSPTSPIQTPLVDVGFGPGCRVVIGTDSQSVKPSNTLLSHVRSRMHLVRGSVHKVTESRIYILASRDDLTRLDTFSKAASSVTTTFRMDKENLPTGITTLRQNLVNLFTADMKSPDSPGSQVEQSRLSWLRDVLIRLRQPVFDRSMVKLIFSPSKAIATPIEPVPGCDLMDLCLEFSTLNQDQQAAVEQVFAAQDYTLIQGLPGSGKTSTIAFVARLLAAHGKRVLVTSYTHTAVDNVLLKLIECGVSSDGINGQALVRVGKKASCHVGVHAILASSIALQLETGLNTQQRQHTLPSSEYLRIAMSNARIVGVTALTIPRSPLLFREHFDVVIVDEAGQISQPAIIGALLAADSFILVGDHMQLPPLVVSELAGQADYGESMLKRLADKHPDCVSQLTYQYRMHEDICQLSNDVVYKGKLKCANDSVAKKTLTLNHFPAALEHSINNKPLLWLSKAIDPSSAVTFLDTDKVNLNSPDSEDVTVYPLESSNNHRSGGSIVNETEGFIVKILIDGLTSCGLEASSIGVISPFRAQLRILDEDESIQNWKKEGLEVSTIDRFQGRDKSVIILSFVRSNTKGKVGHLLEDFRRLNVAVTRAKYKLIMVGSFSTLYEGSDVLKLILDRVSARNHLIQLPSNTSKPHLPRIATSYGTTERVNF